MFGITASLVMGFEVLKCEQPIDPTQRISLYRDWRSDDAGIRRFENLYCDARRPKTIVSITAETSEHDAGHSDIPSDRKSLPAQPTMAEQWTH